MTSCVRIMVARLYPLDAAMKPTDVGGTLTSPAKFDDLKRRRHGGGINIIRVVGRGHHNAAAAPLGTAPSHLVARLAGDPFVPVAIPRWTHRRPHGGSTGCGGGGGGRRGRANPLGRERHHDGGGHRHVGAGCPSRRGTTTRR